MAKVTMLLSLFCFIHLVNLVGQETKFGIIGGGNLSTIIGDLNEFPSSETGTRYSFHIGVFSNIKITDKFSFAPQISFSSQGYRSVGENTFPDFSFQNGNVETGTTILVSDYQDIFNYINMPLELRYAVKDNLDLIFGPQVGFLINSRIKGSFLWDGEGEEENESYDFNPKLDYGVILGASYKLSSKLFCDFKYFQGISNTNRKENIFSSSEIATYNSVLQLSIGYYLF